VKPDGRFHTYNVDLSGEKTWVGHVVRLALTPALGKHARARVRAVRIGDTLQGPADVSVTQARLADAINRAGTPATLIIQFANGGGSDATNLVLSVRKLPRGVRVCAAPGWGARTGGARVGNGDLHTGAGGRPPGFRDRGV
jgi:hypothetical protein